MIQKKLRVLYFDIALRLPKSGFLLLDLVRSSNNVLTVKNKLAFTELLWLLQWWSRLASHELIIL